MLYDNDKETIDSWVMNGFCMLVIDAVRPLEIILVANTDNDISIRKADVTDLFNMEQLFMDLDKHLESSPIYFYGHTMKNYIDEYKEWLKTEGNILWLAEDKSKIIVYLKTNTTEINMDELDDGYTMGHQWNLCITRM